MTATEMFKKACDAWGVEMRSDTDKEFTFRRELFHEGESLGVQWSPEVAQDLRAFHGAEAETKLVLVLLEEVVKALAMPSESPSP